MLRHIPHMRTPPARLPMCFRLQHTRDSFPCSSAKLCGRLANKRTACCTSSALAAVKAGLVHILCGQRHALHTTNVQRLCVVKSECPPPTRRLLMLTSLSSGCLLTGGGGRTVRKTQPLLLVHSDRNIHAHVLWGLVHPNRHCRGIGRKVCVDGRAVGDCVQHLGPHGLKV